jgi:GTP-binding protein of the ras superfamily involved in termination of M-phase
MLPLVTNDSVALLFIFDLCRKATLSAVREWYKQARKLNKVAIPILVGTKFDLLAQSDQETVDSITKSAKKFAKAMKAPLVFVSAKEAINVNKLFKGMASFEGFDCIDIFLVIIAKVFDTECGVEELTNAGEPIILYKDITKDAGTASTSEE